MYIIICGDCQGWMQRSLRRRGWGEHMFPTPFTKMEGWKKGCSAFGVTALLYSTPEIFITLLN